MAKFCSQCGKPLAEGEVCSCMNQSQPDSQQSGEQSFSSQQSNGQSFSSQQSNGQQSNGQSFNSQQFTQTVGKVTNGTKLFVGKIIPILKNPVEELKNIAMTNNMTMGLQMVISNVVLTLLVLIIAMAGVRSKLGDLAEYVSIPYVKIVLLGTITAAAVYFAMAGILLAITKLFVKDSDVTFAQMITIVGGKALYDMGVLVIGILFMLLNTGLGMFLIVAGSVFTYLVMVVTYCSLVRMQESKKVYVLAITYFCMMIVAYLIVRILLGSVVEEFAKGSLGSLMNGYSSQLF